MRIAMTGSSGLIGTAVRKSLTVRGRTVVRLGRTVASVDGADAVVHLGGEGLADGRWTADKKRRIRESRVGPTRALATLLAGMERKPRVLICASAIGVYGDRGDESVTELAEPGTGFLADVVKEWEKAADPARDAGIRVVHARFGVVLSPNGGALRKMLPVFRAGLGGKLDGGQRWMSWISLGDVVRALEFLLDNETVNGAVNLTAPQPVRNAEFTRALARAVHRPAIFNVPRFALRALFGEMADEALLSNIRALPEKLLGEDFRFENVDLEPTLKAMLSKP